MRPRNFYGKEIQFTSEKEQKDFEDTVFLEPGLKISPGKIIGRGAFREIREAILENLDTGNMQHLVQKKVHHPMAKRLPLLEAFRWWKLRKIGAPVIPLYKIDPDRLEMYGTDLRSGHGNFLGQSQVFDTNASPEQIDDLNRIFAEKPLKNPQEIVEQVRGIILLFDKHGISTHTDEVFLMVVQEHEAVLQVLLGDLKMIDLEGNPEENVRSAKTLLSFLSQFGVVA